MIRSHQYFLLKLSLLIGIFLLELSCTENNITADKKIKEDTTPITLQTPSDNIPAKEASTNNAILKHETYNEDINNLPSSLAGFVPEGYTAIDTVTVI